MHDASSRIIARHPLAAGGFIHRLGNTMKIFGTHDEQTIVQFQHVRESAVDAALMADGHVGYVMPIGGVAAYRDQLSVVAVGFDIACGNAAIRTDMSLASLGDDPERNRQTAAKTQLDIHLLQADNGNAQSCHPSFVAVTPHGGQLMMTLNGATSAGVEVWNSGPITVVNGGLYNFSAWATSVYPNDPANLEFLINGVSIGTLQLTSGTPDWSQFSQNWFANTTSATLSIIDLDLGFDGNDFAIDDISFDPIRIPNQVPEPMTLALIGAGLAGLGFGRRRS